MRVLFSICCGIVLCSFYSCKTVSSDLNVVNGIQDTDNKYPAVLPILMEYKNYGGEYTEDIHSKDYPVCSSSVISHNTLLTASHCFCDVIAGTQGVDKRVIDPDYIRVILPSGEKVEAKSFYCMEGYKELALKEDIGEIKENAEELIQKDVGIVVFDDGTFDGITPLKISNQRVKEKDPVLFVGYSCQTDIPNERKEDKYGNIRFIPFRVCHNTEGQENGSVRRYGRNEVSENTQCGSASFEVRSSIENYRLNPNMRKDSVGVNSIVWFGDSGGPILSYNNQNLILGLPAKVIDGVDANGEEYGGVCAFTFSDDTIKWLRKIDKTTDANIPLDGIK